MIKRLIIVVTLLLCAIPSHAQSFVQVQSADGTNPTATFTNNTAAGNTIVATPGCDTNLYSCPSTTLPTDLTNPGVLFSLVTTCTATNNGTASRTNIYVAYNIPGGARDSISYQGGNVQMVIMELSGATAVDQAVCTTGHLNTGGTVTSGPITTTHPAEVVLGVGTANCSPSCTSTDFTAIGTPNWTLGTIGTQVAEYQSLTSITSSSATATVSGGSGGTPNESYAMSEVSFWNAPRVQGTACETGGSVGYTTCSLSGVTAGDTLLWFANANNNGGFSITNTCGGTNTTVDSNYVAGGSSVAQGYITGGSGSCTVTFTSTGGYAVAAVLEEITSGYLIDKHSLLAYQSGNAITTASVTTTAVDYCFTGYADQGGHGQPSSLTALSPFVQHDFTLTFPTWGANATQTSAGALTATWTSSGSGGTPRPAAGMMCFSKPSITLTLNPQTVASGYSSVGTVVLGAPAPPSGVLVTLSSSDTAVAMVPLSVSVPAGSASATFTVNTGSVSSSRLVNISATYNSATNVAILGVVPVNASPQYSIWSSSSTPSVSDDGGTAAVEVGVKFTADTSGFVSGIRFYKSAANTGSHVGSLWTSTGQLLATATFTGESTSGWQTVNFSSPILLTPNTIYVASYHTNTGHTSADPNYFTNIGVDNSPLHAPASGASGGNGVRTLSAGSAFPTTINLDSNYWVDVIFLASASPPPLQSLTLNPTNVTGGSTSIATVTLNIPAPSGGALVALSTGNIAVATLPPSLLVAPGATSATFTVNTSPVAASTPVAISASLAGVIVSGTLTLSTGGSGGSTLATDVKTSVDRATASSTVATSAFSTASINELLLAFVATDHESGANATVTSIAGGGLTWVLVARSNVRPGTSEIWRAFAPAQLSNVAVTATLSESVVSSMTVVSFAGVDTTGTNGSGAIGATKATNASTGAPTATLATTRNGSWVFGVGNDYTNAIARTPETGQTLVHQDLSPSGDTYWVQMQNTPTSLSGTSVSINDTAPTGDQYNLAICEVLPLGAAGGIPSTITATSGSGQSTAVGTAFAAPLVVTVKDSGSNPVVGVTVTFTPPSSGASGTFAAGANTAITNASGVATSSAFSANSTAGGPYNVAATVTGVATPANFALTNTAGTPNTITATSGSGQSTAVGTAFAAPLVVTVKDSGSNPVVGVTVTFTPPSSGASGTFAAGANTAITNASGVATSSAFSANSTAGGPYNVAATVTGVATPANFALTNTAGTPNTITATSGSGQSTAVGTAFAAPLVVTVKDSGSNPVVGVTVTFTPPSSGASGTFAAGANTAITNASGVATSSAFSANSAAGGPYNVAATATGVATPANFALTNTAGVGIAPVVTTNPTNQAVTAGATVTFTAAASGTPAPTVQWQVSIDGGTTFSNVAGAISATLSFATTAAQNGNRYQAVFTNTLGTATTTAAILTVTSAQSFWSTSTVPGNITGNDSASVELGLRFSSNVTGHVIGVRVYCATNSSGTHTVHLWNSSGASLATATLPACKGWTAVNFSSPVAIAANTTYTISYHTIQYPWNTSFFTSALTVGNLTAPINAGVYAYGSSPAYPTSTWSSANYWIDVLFTTP